MRTNFLLYVGDGEKILNYFHFDIYKHGGFGIIKDKKRAHIIYIIKRKKKS